MADRILILGAGLMQGPAIRFAKERGLEAVVVDGDASAACVPMADRFERIDLKDRLGLEAFARKLAAEGGLSGVMTAGTDFSASVAWVAEKLGLPGIPYETALDASDKARMRERFKAENVPSPDFVVLSSVLSASDPLPFAFPAVVKPVDNMGSRGCRRVDDAGGLASAVEDSLRYSRSGRAIVEEYMDGPEFSVDSLVHRGEITVCGLADRHIFFPPYFIEMGHTIPSALSGEDAARLLDVFKRGVRALGIRDGAAKGDVKLTAKGPMIGEIAARLSGGYMSGWTYPYASGVEPTAGAVAIAVGAAPTDLEPTRSLTCAERAFISVPGVVTSVQGKEKASKVDGVRDIFMRIEGGSVVRFPENNVSKCGNVIAAASSRACAVAAAEDAARMLLIRLAAPNTETEAFLARRSSVPPSFPPDAFSLPAALKAELAALVDPEPSLSAAAAGRIALLPFPSFLTSGLRDYVGRGVDESLDAVRTLTGLDLPVIEASEAGAAPGRTLLGARFWAALVRGGYQGGTYVVDALRSSGPGPRS